MPKQNTAPQYHAGDLLDLASLAHEQLEYLRIGFADIRKELLQVKEELARRDVSNGYQFYILEKKVEIFEYLTQDYQCAMDRSAQEYEAEWKGGEA